MRPVLRYGHVRRLAVGFGLALALAVLPAAAPTVLAQEAPGDRQAAESGQAGGRGQAPEGAELDALTAEVAAELRCPVCRNQSVLESSAELSREMQATVRSRLAAGESPEEVKEYFVDRYGEWILLKPTARGMNLAVYALPALVLLLGGAFLVVRLRGWARGGPGTERPPLPELEGAETTGQGAADSPATGMPTAPEEPATPPAGLEKFSEADRRWLDEAVRRS